MYETTFVVSHCTISHIVRYNLYILRPITCHPSPFPPIRVSSYRLCPRAFDGCHTTLPTICNSVAHLRTCARERLNCIGRYVPTRYLVFTTSSPAALQGHGSTQGLVFNPPKPLNHPSYHRRAWTSCYKTDPFQPSRRPS